ncbi:MAG: caspase family protein [Thermodesulfovibrionales bacterium]
MKTFKKITLSRILFALSILFLSSCMATPDIHVKSSDMAMEIKQKAPIINAIAVSPDGRYVLSSSFDHNLRLWDISDGKEIRKLSGHSVGYVGDYLSIAFTPDGGKIVSGGRGLKVWDLSTGNELRSFGNVRVVALSVSSDGRYILSGSWGESANVTLWDESSGKEIVTFAGKYKRAYVQSAALSPDGKYALLGYCRGVTDLVLWDVLSGNPIKTVKGSEKVSWIVDSRVNSVSFSPDGKYALSGGNDGSVRLWSIPGMNELKTLGKHSLVSSIAEVDGVSSVAFSPDGRFAVSGGYDQFIKIWDVSTGVEIKTFKVHSGTVATEYVSVVFSPDEKFIISGGDASVRVWDVASGEEIATMIGFEDGEWLTITPEGYYNSSEKGAQHLSVKVDDKSYSVESFYDVFYRPDIVAAKLRGDDISGLITITMKDAIKSPPPVVEISPITASPTSPRAKVCYNVKSTGGGIGEVRLFHNGKLIESDGYYKEAAKSVVEKTQLAKLDSKAIYEDMRSVQIKAKAEISPVTTKSKGEVFNDCKEIDAISGENEISVTAFNKDNTVQGYMQTAKFTSTIKPEEPHLYILSIGIDQYKDNTINLKYAVKDSKDIEDKILKQAETLYKPQNIHYEFLIDDKATKANITGKINELSKLIKPTDSFILFVAGHGVLLQNQYYMLTYEYDGKVNDNNLISSNEIVEISKKIKSLSQLFIFDTCHAGGVDYIVSGLYDARMSVLAKKMGLHIYASANSKEAAMDGYQGNGLFTYTLLDGLNNKKEADKNKDSKISLVELGEYTKQTTTEISKKIGHQQTPLIINFGKDNAVYNLR